MLRCTITAILCLAATASADPEVLFKEGRELVEADDWERGCAKFEEAYEQSQKPSIEANLAMCAEREGALPKAWRMYLSAAEKWGDDKRSAQMREGAAGVARRATVVVVRVPDPALDELRITLAGREVQPASEIRELVMPGEITLSAKARGYRPWRQTVTGKAGETLAVEVALEEASETKTVATSHRRRSRVYLSIGLGVVALGAFTTSYFVARAASEDQDAIKADPMYCQPMGCTDEGLAKIDDTQRRLNIATGVAIGGAVVAAGALVVFFTAPRDTVVTPIVTSQAGGISLTARF